MNTIITLVMLPLLISMLVYAECIHYLNTRKNWEYIQDLNTKITKYTVQAPIPDPTPAILVGLLGFSMSLVWGVMVGGY